jgi:hypothetical protein
VQRYVPSVRDQSKWLSVCIWYRRSTEEVSVGRFPDSGHQHTYLIEEDVLAIASLSRKVLQIAIVTDAVLLT